MNIYKKFYFFTVLIFGHFFMQANLFASNLDGTTSLVYKNQHHVFSDGESARGFVRMNGGFTIKPAAKATLDTVVTVSGVIDLRETGILQLIKNLNLDTGVTWSSGGNINGRGNTIILNDTLSIPASKIIHITGDTSINGQENNLILNDNAQIIVESNATLTLRNLMLKNVRNNQSSPCIKMAANTSKLALENVKLAFVGDMEFSKGQLYAHNDVVFSGTSSFLYTSAYPSFITKGGTLLFDIGTSFTFAPASTNNELLVLQDATASLAFNGSSLSITSTGMRLTKGNLIFKNKVTLQSQDIIHTFSSSALTSQDYGVALYTLAWNPTGTVIAIGGNRPANPAGGFSNFDELRLYSFNGSTLTPLTSQDLGTDVVTAIESLAWNPTGTVLAVGGYTFSSGQELQLFSFNGSTLTLLDSVSFGNTSSAIRSLAWNPAGTVLAAGGQNATGGNELQLYSFNGSTLSGLTSQDYGPNAGGSIIYSVVWHPNGTVLAIGGYGPTSGDELQLFSFNGATLSLLTSQDYGTIIYSLAWNSAGTVLAVGGYVPTSGDELQLFNFNGSTLSLLTSLNYGSNINSLDWHPNDTVLAVGGFDPASGNELQLFDFNGSTLSLLSSFNTGEINSLGWNPSGTVLAIGGSALILYGANFTTSYQTLNSSTGSMLTFGNSTLGENYDLNVEVLGGAHVIVEGSIVDDSA